MSEERRIIELLLDIICRERTIEANVGFLTEQINNANIRLIKIESILRPAVAISAKGTLMPATIHVNGKGATFTFTEFDGLAGTGNVVPPSGPITYVSSNVTVATVDATGQVAAVAPGTCSISGSDPASANQVSASDTLTVTADAAVSATGVLTAN